MLDKPSCGSILRPTDLQDSTSAIWTLRCPVNLRHMRHQIPKHSQLPKRRCPWETGSILVVCVSWRYIVIRLFDRDVDEDSDKISATCPCSFPVAQGTYYWFTRYISVPSQRAVETPKLRSFLCILRWRRCWTGALPFFSWKDLQRCHVVDFPGWQLGASEGEYPLWKCCNIFQSVGVILGLQGNMESQDGDRNFNEFHKLERMRPEPVPMSKCFFAIHLPWFK